MPEEDQGIGGFNEKKDKRHNTVYCVPYCSQRRKNASVPKWPSGTQFNTITRNIIKSQHENNEKYLSISCTKLVVLKFPKTH